MQRGAMDESITAPPLPKPFLRTCGCCSFLLPLHERMVSLSRSRAGQSLPCAQLTVSASGLTSDAICHPMVMLPLLAVPIAAAPAWAVGSVMVSVYGNVGSVTVTGPPSVLYV